MEFRKRGHLQVLEENVVRKKKEFQRSDAAREILTYALARKTDNAISKEGRDCAEVTPTAMSNHVCNTCSKDFQNLDDLGRQFEQFERAGQHRFAKL
jgi:hypothetical protein